MRGQEGFQTNSVVAHGPVHGEAALRSRCLPSPRSCQEGKIFVSRYELVKPVNLDGKRKKTEKFWCTSHLTGGPKIERSGFMRNCYSVRRLFDCHLRLWELHSKCSFNEFIRISYLKGIWRISRKAVFLHPNSKVLHAAESPGLQRLIKVPPSYFTQSTN